MSLYDWTMRRSAWTEQTDPWEERDYLVAEVDAKEAAAILHVSASRWRQITGSREGTPDPVIGPGRTEPGRRGALWPLHRVLQYAMSTHRDLSGPVPSLLPNPDGRPRYSASSSQALRVAGPATTSDSSGRATAWGDLYHPVEHTLCGHREASVLMLTPTWPTTVWTLLPNLGPLVGAALTSQRWDVELSAIERLVVVIAIADDGSYGRLAPTHLMTYQVSADGIREARNLLAAVEAQTTSSPDKRLLATRAEVPARHVAASLGHPVPWWPQGTATSSTCPRWSPGHPLTVTVPAGEAGRLEAAQWLQQPGIIRPRNPFNDQLTHPAESPDVSLDDQALRLASLALPSASLMDLQPPMENSDLPEGLEVAAHIARPAPITGIDASIDPWPLLDSLLDDDNGVPPHIADELYAFFGDPRYAPLASLELTSLPDLWAELFRQQSVYALTTPTRSERWRRLRTANPEGQAVTFGPLKSPAMITDSTLTWLPPTGNQSNGPDAPANALPRHEDMPHEVLLARESVRGWIRGWVRTLNGRLIPLPARTQIDMGTHGDAITLLAALREQDPRDIYDASMETIQARLDEASDGSPARNPLDPIEESSVLRLLRSVTDEPLTLTWAELQTLTHD